MSINFLEGKVVATEGMKVGIIASRFNSFIVEKLLDGAVDGLVRHGVDEQNIDAAWVPGAFEIPVVAQKMAESGKYDAVICWNIGSYYEINELRDVYVPRMIEYGLTPEQINSNIASSYCEYITWNACKVAALKEVPLQIVDRNEKAIILENDEYYTLLGREFGYGRIEYNSKAGESISGEGVKLLKKGKIQDEAIVPIVFNMIIFS